MNFANEKVTIAGSAYRVTQLPYKLGHRILLRLYKILGPTLARGLANAPSLDGGLATLNVKELGPAFAAAVQTLADVLTEEDFDFVVDTLAEYTELSKGDDKWVPLKQEMELHFAGNYGVLFQWLGFALKVNFGGFIGEQGLGSLLEKIQKAKAPLSRSTSTGTSTGSPVLRGTPAP